MGQVLRDYQIAATVEIGGGDINGSAVRPARDSSPPYSLCFLTFAVVERSEEDVEVMFVDISSGDYETGLVIFMKTSRTCNDFTGLICSEPDQATWAVCQFCSVFGLYRTATERYQSAPCGSVCVCGTRRQPIAIGGADGGRRVPESRSLRTGLMSSVEADGEASLPIWRGRIPVVAAATETQMSLGGSASERPAVCSADDQLWN